MNENHSLTNLSNSGQNSSTTWQRDPPEVSDTLPTDCAGTSGSKGPDDAARAWHDLSRRIATWSCNFLATLLVLVAGIGFGRQVLRWWYETDPPRPKLPQIPSSSAGLAGGFHAVDDPTLGVTELTFGGSPWVWTRGETSGSAETAYKRLTSLVQSRTSRASLPADSIPESESRLLERIGEWETWSEEAGRLRVLGLRKPIPVVMGIRMLDRQSEGADKLWDPSRARIVCWGFAIPEAENRWRLDVFWLGPPGQLMPDHPQSLPPQIPQSFAVEEQKAIPGIERLVRFRAPGLGEQAVYYGPGPLETWQQFFDRLSRAEGVDATGPWSWLGATCHREYARRDGNGTFYSVYITPREDGSYFGLWLAQ